MSRLYNRVCEMNLAGRVFVYPPMTLEFETEFSISAPSQTKAKIMNPAPETIAACEKKKDKRPLITISAGYEEEYGTCVVGEIVKFEAKKGGADTILELTISDKTSLWSDALVNKSWKGYITARQAVTEILKDFGVTPADMFFGDEKVYKTGLSFSGTPLLKVLERVAIDTKSTFAFRNGQASFLSAKTGTGKSIALRYDSGLIESTKTEIGYKVKALFMYKIQGGSLVALQKGEETINVKVVKGKRQFSPQNAFTEFEAVKL